MFLQTETNMIKPYTQWMQESIIGPQRATISKLDLFSLDLINNQKLLYECVLITPTTYSKMQLRTCKTILWKQKHTSTPWTRWINTVKTTLLQAVYWLNSVLVLSYSGQNKIFFIWISWKFAATITDSKIHLICWDFDPHRKNTAQRENKQRDVWSEKLTIIWISHLHTCRSCSLLTYILFRAHRTPWLVRTRNTIAKPPARLKKKPNNALVGGNY